MKVLRGAAFACVAVLLALGGCERRMVGSDVPAIVIPVENDVQTLDPTLLSDPYTSRIVWQMYEGLVGVDSSDRVVGMLAESWSASDDFTTWTFRIRPNVHFHKNAAFRNPDSTRSVTAQDVVYSYERFAKGFGSFVFAGLVDGFDEYARGSRPSVSGFAAVDSLTFRVRLLRPDRAFIYRISSPYLAIMPREVVEAAGQDFGQNVASGTGPFLLETRNETEITVRRNPYYWKNSGGNLTTVVFRVEKNPGFLSQQLRNGTYRLGQIGIQSYPEFFAKGELHESLRGDLRSYARTTYNVHYLGINVPTVADPLVRRAIALAIDKAAIAQRLLYGQASPAPSPVPAGMLSYSPPPGLPFNRDSARLALRASSYRGNPLTLLVSDAPNSEQLGEVIQASLREIGLATTIEKTDFNTLITRLFGSRRPDLFVIFSEWVFGAPELIMDVYKSDKYPNPNLFGFRNSSVDSLLEVASRENDRSRINGLLRQAEIVANGQPPAVWLFHQRSVFMMDSRLSGFWVSPHNHWSLADARWSSGRRE